MENPFKVQWSKACHHVSKKMLAGAWMFCLPMGLFFLAGAMVDLLVSRHLEENAWRILLIQSFQMHIFGLIGCVIISIIVTRRYYLVTQKGRLYKAVIKERYYSESGRGSYVYADIGEKEDIILRTDILPPLSKEGDIIEIKMYKKCKNIVMVMM